MEMTGGGPVIGIHLSARWCRLPLVPQINFLMDAMFYVKGYSFIG